MTDRGVQLLIGLAFFFALAASGVACALWWRLNQVTRRLAGVEAHQDGMHAWATVTHADVRWLLDHTDDDGEPDEVPEPDPEPPTTPIGDHIDAALARFDFTGGQRP